MKSVVIREITALVLRPAAPATITPTVPADVPKAKHIRFTDDDDGDDSKPKSKPKAATDTKKPAPAGNTHARYYATITFNQIVLAPGDKDVALKLIDVYFEVFKEILGEGGVDGADDDEQGDGPGKTSDEILKDKKGRVVDRGGKKGKRTKGKRKEREVTGAAGFTEVEDSSSRLVSAILTGVNRALPFAKVDAGDVG